MLEISIVLQSNKYVLFQFLHKAIYGGCVII